MSAKTRTILYGAPFAWLHLIDDSAVSLFATFDNLATKPIYTAPKSASEAASGETLDIERADKLKWRAPLDAPVLDIDTEAVIESASTGSDATGKGKITIVTNQAPVEVAFTSYTKFIEQLIANKDKKWLITIPTGFTYVERTSTKKPDGFVHMIGKITNDISDAEAPSKLPIEFDSYDITGTGCDSTDLPTTAFWATKTATWKLGGVGKDVTITVPEFTSDQATALANGEMVFVENPQA